MQSQNKSLAEADRHLVVFNNKEIRRIIHNNEWCFSVVDVIEVLTDSENPSTYWRVLKHRLSKEEGSEQTVTNCNGFKMLSKDGRLRETDCANTETLFRIIQSIPSPKAEPFKRWLAKVGYERVQEIEDPELASKRARTLYQAKGYPQSWIEKRVRGIAIREELTDEWKNREVGGNQEYAILTAEISKATFGLTPSEYKNLKGLKRENLRDHMNDLELIFTMLGEASTTEIARKNDAMGFEQNKSSAVRGGRVAGNARKELETQTGKKIVTGENYLPPGNAKRIKGANDG